MGRPRRETGAAAGRPWPRPNVALTGFMGAGKTACGRLVAEGLRAEFIDVDERIEKRAGAPIPEIFARRGESGFRELERDAIREACRGKGSIIACGGGAVLLAENRTVLRERCLVVWLRASVATVMERLEGAERDERPLLKGSDPTRTVRRLLAEREPLYRRADAVVETDGRAVREVAAEVLAVVTGWKE